VSQLWPTIFPPAKPPQVSVAFVLDVSPAMLQRFGDTNTTRLKAAEADILDYVKKSSDTHTSTSLRLVKGCGSASSSQPTISFGTHKPDRYQSVFNNLAANEKSVSSYGNGLGQATSALTTQTISDNGDKKLIVFAAETCPPGRLPQVPFGDDKVTVVYFWLGPRTEQISQVRSELTKQGFVSLQIYGAKSKKALKKAVSHTVTQTIVHVTPQKPTRTLNSPTLATGLSETSGSAGDTVSASAALSGATTDAGGKVTYTVYSDNGCSSVFADGGTVDVTSGQVPDSNGVLFDEAGTYYWQAVYSGDNHNKSASDCDQQGVVINPVESNPATP
jgi:hypothetical protein